MSLLSPDMLSWNRYRTSIELDHVIQIGVLSILPANRLKLEQQGEKNYSRPESEGERATHYRIPRSREGRMGRVYVAQHEKLHRHVALKFLPEHLTRDER